MEEGGLMSLINPITVDYFLEEIAEECVDYLIKIKLKYDHETDYRYTITTLKYNFDMHLWIFDDDFDEGEQEIYIIDYISFDDVFLD